MSDWAGLRVAAYPTPGGPRVAATIVEFPVIASGHVCALVEASDGLRYFVPEGWWSLRADRTRYERWRDDYLPLNVLVLVVAAACAAERLVAGVLR